MFENYFDCLFNDKYILQSQQRFKSDYHDVYTEKINKIALSSNDDERLQTFDKITTHPYGINTVKVCESEMMIVRSHMLENCTYCPFYYEIILQSQQRFKCVHRTSQ